MRSEATKLMDVGAVTPVEKNSNFNPEKDKKEKVINTNARPDDSDNVSGKVPKRKVSQGEDDSGDRVKRKVDGDQIASSRNVKEYNKVADKVLQSKQDLNKVARDNGSLEVSVGMTGIIGGIPAKTVTQYYGNKEPPAPVQIET